jgi:hypothetical protein
MKSPPAVDIECPRCGAQPGRPCWRMWQVRGTDPILLNKPPEAGYCQDRHARARGRA